MEVTQPISLRLRPDVHQRIKELACNEANTESAILRRVITAGLRTLDSNPTANGSPAAERPA